MSNESKKPSSGKQSPTSDENGETCFDMKTAGFGLVQKRRPHELRDFVTPEDDLFRVWHLGIPDLDPSRWTLRIEGLVERPQSLSLAELRQFAADTVMTFHECAGNPLSPLIPQRRIGNVVWGGVRLTELLHHAGVRNEASFVISRGADHGTYGGTHHQVYEKDLPISKALENSVLVALTLNGEPISVERGGPVRLVVPGFYGTNSTKWLTKLLVSGERSKGAFTTRYYMDREVVGGEVHETPVWAVAPNSIIVEPANGQVVANREFEVWGWSWSAFPIVKVEVSTNGGESWETADVQPRSAYEWQRFRFNWRPKSVGEYILVARAADSNGGIQPLTLCRNQVFRAIVFVQAE